MSIGTVALAFALVAGGTGCVSVQVLDASTHLPRVLGWGSVTRLPVAEGTICRVCAPGLSLRFGSFAPGLTLGWHETLLFLPATNAPAGAPPPTPIAMQTRDYGLGLAPFGVSLGSERRFAVFEPPSGESIRQTIVFAGNALTNTIIERETHL